MKHYIVTIPNPLVGDPTILGVTPTLESARMLLRASRTPTGRILEISNPTVLHNTIIQQPPIIHTFTRMAPHKT